MGGSNPQNIFVNFIGDITSPVIIKNVVAYARTVVECNILSLEASLQ